MVLQASQPLECVGVELGFLVKVRWGRIQPQFDRRIPFWQCKNKLYLAKLGRLVSLSMMLKNGFQQFEQSLSR